MEVKDFPLCCGINVITGFPTSITSKEDKSLIEDELTNAIYLSERENVGLVMATVAGPQRKAMAPIFKKFKFEKIKSFRNPNSGNMVTVYQKRVNTKPR